MGYAVLESPDLLYFGVHTFPHRCAARRLCAQGQTFVQGLLDALYAVAPRDGKDLVCQVHALYTGFFPEDMADEWFSKSLETRKKNAEKKKAQPVGNN